MLPHREPLQISAWSHERRWSIRGTEPFQSPSLIDGRTDDLAEVARAARAWHDGEALNDIGCRSNEGAVDQAVGMTWSR